MQGNIWSKNMGIPQITTPGLITSDKRAHIIVMLECITLELCKTVEEGKHMKFLNELDFPTLLLHSKNQNSVNYRM